MRGVVAFALASLVLPPALSQGEDAGYLDASACASCHSGIYESYRRTGMGRSFYRPGSSDAADFVRNNTYYHKASDEHYTMYERGGRRYQRRHQVGPGGGEINVVEMQIDFVLGSGSHARTYLNRTAAGQLIELPVGWYPENGGFWAMSPGYDRPGHMDFRRKLDRECFFCHNAYPKVETGYDTGTREFFLSGEVPEGIDCQRCHGPGRAHVEAVERRAPVEAIRKAIVNPARLSADRQLEVCLQCHLESTSHPLPYAVRRYGRGFFSYRPGEPLENYILHFDHAPGTDRDDKFEISHAAYRLMKSACFRRSKGALTCTTCHDPHGSNAEKAAQRYVQVCKSCHADAHNATENCLSCHMPKRRTEDVVHAVMTDHYIQRRKPDRDLLAPLSEIADTQQTAYRGEVTLLYPPRLPATPESELYLAVAQVSDGSNLTSGVLRLQRAIERYQPKQAEFYFALADAYRKSGQYEKGLPYYREALARRPDYLAAQLDCAAALGGLDKLPAAIQMLETAVAGAPREAGSLNALGESYLRSGRLDEAIATLQRALSIDSNVPEIFVNLGAALSRTGKQSGAVDTLLKALRISPGFGAAHSNLAEILATRGDFPQARYHFEKAILAEPGSAVTHYNYGRALAQNRMLQEAEPELETALRLDPRMAEAATSLGIVLAGRGQWDAAIDRYRQALRVKPGLAAAHLNLGMALIRRGEDVEAKQHFETILRSNENDYGAHFYLGKVLAGEGDYESAIRHLRKASESPQPELRDAALEGLRTVRQKR